MNIEVIGLNPTFDRGDKRNAGVEADEFVGPGGGGAMLRRVTYTDSKGTTYKYLTTEMKLPTWVIVLLFKQLWDLEKVYARGEEQDARAQVVEATRRAKPCTRI